MRACVKKGWLGYLGLLVALPLAVLGAGCSAPQPSGATGIVPIERVGVCSWSYQQPLDGVASEMKQTGVTGIHLALGPFISPDERHGSAEGAAALQAVKARLASGEWRLFSTMVSFPQEDYSTLERIRETGGIVPDACWERNKVIVEKAVALTRELGAPYLTLHAGFLDEHNPQAYATFKARVAWMRDLCKQNGIGLLLESGQETAEDLASFMQEMPGVGINFDPANMILYGKGCPQRAVKTLMPWIRQVHVKDAVPSAVPGVWGAERAWGEGEVGAQAFVAELQELGYAGNFVIEREGGNQRATDIARAVGALTGRTAPSGK